MRALGQAGLPVPVAVDHNRHAVLMSLVDATLLAQVLPAERNPPEAVPQAALRSAGLLITHARARAQPLPCPEPLLTFAMRQRPGNSTPIEAALCSPRCTAQCLSRVPLFYTQITVMI